MLLVTLIHGTLIIMAGAQGVAADRCRETLAQPGARPWVESLVIPKDDIMTICASTMAMSRAMLAEPARGTLPGTMITGDVMIVEGGGVRRGDVESRGLKPSRRTLSESQPWGIR